MISVAYLGYQVYSAITFQQHANVIATGSVVYYLDGSVWSSGDVNWGDIAPGQTLTKALNVTNNKNAAVTLVLTVALPSGWVQSWSLNNTAVAAFSAVAGVLSLTAPSDAVAGPVSFNSQITP
jgi:hypothetical protein